MHPRLALSLTNVLSAAVLAASLAGCGGGGGGGGVTPAPAPVIPVPVAPVPAPSFQLGGAVTGLGDGVSITLRNGSDTLNMAANGTFTLPTRLAGGATYSVSTTTPAGYSCSVSDGAGTVGAADITKIAVKCTVLLLAGRERVIKDAYAVAVDANGARYVLDSKDQVIWRVTTAGAVEVFAGIPNTRGHQDGAAGVATIFTNVNSKMAFDPRGNLILADTCNGLIRSITPAGVISTIAGQLQPGCEDTPSGVTEKEPADGPGATAVFSGPAQIAVDGAGNIAVVEEVRNVIRRIGIDGVVTTITSPANTLPITGIAAIAYDKDNHLLMAVSFDGAGRIFRLDSGTPVPLDGVAPLGNNYGAVSGMVADKNGNLYLNDGLRLRKRSADGVVTTFAGSSTSQHLDGVGTAASFVTINNFALNPDGGLTVLEAVGYQLRPVSAAGVVTTLAATPVGREYADGKGAAARFSAADTLASAADGTVYTIDAVQNVVRKIAADGTVSLFAGIPGKSGSDNGAVAVATFARPTAITVDGNGAVFVIDNSGLRKIADGVVSAIMPGSLIRGSGFVRRMSDGRFVVATLTQVYIFSATGTLLTKIENSTISTALGISDDAYYINFRGIEVDASNNVYIGDNYHSVVLRYSSAGVMSLFAGKINVAGSADGAAGTGSLSFQTIGDMTIDSSGNLYLSGQGNVRKISPQGVLSTPALAWGRPDVLGITARNGLLYGSINAAILQAPLP